MFSLTGPIVLFKCESGLVGGFWLVFVVFRFVVIGSLCSCHGVLFGAFLNLWSCHGILFGEVRCSKVLCSDGMVHGLKVERGLNVMFEGGQGLVLGEFPIVKYCVCVFARIFGRGFGLEGDWG